MSTGASPTSRTTSRSSPTGPDRSGRRGSPRRGAARSATAGGVGPATPAGASTSVTAARRPSAALQQRGEHAAPSAVAPAVGESAECADEHRPARRGRASGHRLVLRRRSTTRSARAGPGRSAIRSATLGGAVGSPGGRGDTRPSSGTSSQGCTGNSETSSIGPVVRPRRRRRAAAIGGPASTWPSGGLSIGRLARRVTGRVARPASRSIAGRRARRLGHVDVRVGVEADQRGRRRDDPPGEVGVQVLAHRDDHRRAERARPGRSGQRRVRGPASLGDQRAVQASTSPSNGPPARSAVEQLAAQVGAAPAVSAPPDMAQARRIGNGSCRHRRLRTSRAGGLGVGPDRAVPSASAARQ